MRWTRASRGSPVSWRACRSSRPASAARLLAALVVWGCPLRFRLGSPMALRPRVARGARSDRAPAPRAPAACSRATRGRRRWRACVGSAFSRRPLTGPSRPVILTEVHARIRCQRQPVPRGSRPKAQWGDPPAEVVEQICLLAPVALCQRGGFFFLRHTPVTSCTGLCPKKNEKEV